MARRFGYSRVSTSEQDWSLQLEALTKAGVDDRDIFREKASGANWQRTELRRMLDLLRPGDQATVYRLDRLARSQLHLLQIMEEIEGKGAKLVSLMDNIDTGTATGKMVVGVLAVLAEFERNLLMERCAAGVKIARQRNVRFGRPPKLTPSLIRQVLLTHDDTSTTVPETCRVPDTPVEVWATDEHRIGLKPIIRRVWAPKGQRPIALGHHRYKWLYVTAFVQPSSGETFWSVSNGVSKPFFAALLALFAREAGAGRARMIVLGLASAGWHTAPNLVVPDGIRLAYLPPDSPELQPAEPLWPVLDEPLANQYFETLADLERAVAERCLVLDGDQLSLGTNFHWWPKPTKPS